MNKKEKMVPITISIDKERLEKLKSVSRATRVPMSEIVRISLDNLIEIVGDPKKPDMEKFGKLLFSQTSILKT